MAIHNREVVIKLALRIASLRENIASAEEELRRAEAEFDVFLAPPSLFHEKLQAALAPSQTETIDDKSLNQQIIDLIDVMCVTPSDGLDADLLVQGLPEGTNVTSVRSALARLADQGKIRRTTRGRYGSAKFGPMAQTEIAS